MVQFEPFVGKSTKAEYSNEQHGFLPTLFCRGQCVHPEQKPFAGNCCQLAFTGSSGTFDHQVPRTEYIPVTIVFLVSFSHTTITPTWIPRMVEYKLLVSTQLEASASTRSLPEAITGPHHLPYQLLLLKTESATAWRSQP